MGPRWSLPLRPRTGKRIGAPGSGPAGSRPLPCPPKGNSSRDLSGGGGILALSRAEAGNSQVPVRQGVTAAVRPRARNRMLVRAQTPATLKPLRREDLDGESGTSMSSTVDTSKDQGIIAGSARARQKAEDRGQRSEVRGKTWRQKYGEQKNGIAAMKDVGRKMSDGRIGYVKTVRRYLPVRYLSVVPSETRGQTSEVRSRRMTM